MFSPFVQLAKVKANSSWLFLQNNPLLFIVRFTFEVISSLGGIFTPTQFTFNSSYSSFPLPVMRGAALVSFLAALFAVLPAVMAEHATVSSSKITVIESKVLEGNILPGFLFSQGRVEGGGTNINLGGGRGTPRPFIPNDNVDMEVWEGAMDEERSPQLPWLSQDQWTCDRTPEEFEMVTLENSMLKANISPHIAGKVWNLFDKKNNREMFFNNPAHQPANIGALKAWAAGGLEWNWSPGIVGHSAFSESPVFVAKIETYKGPAIRVYEYDRYNSTTWQVDMLLDGDEFWAHPKMTNPTDVDLRGYFWVCAAHSVTPASRVVAPADHVAESCTGQIRDAPWPYFAETLNTTFTGLPPPLGTDIWKQDHSYLGNIVWGDFFLRIPKEKDRYIMHVDGKDAYSVYHGHPLNGTKFFTWGNSGPGRFMQDFLSANAADRGGDYAELQTGPAPTQLQNWPLPAKSVYEWTDFFKSWMPTEAEKARLQNHDYQEALDATNEWLYSPKGVSKAKRAEMDNFFKVLANVPVEEKDILHRGMPWGALNEKLRAKLGLPAKMAPGLLFTLDRTNVEVKAWLELLEDGNFSAETLDRLPVSYQVSEEWRMLLEQSARKHGMTWLHALHLGIIATETGLVDLPKQLFTLSLDQRPNPIAARNLAILQKTPAEAFIWYKKALAIAFADATEPSRIRVLRNLGAEVAQFIQSNTGVEWKAALAAYVDDLKTRGAPKELMRTDQVITSIIKTHIYRGEFEAAVEIMSKECFPTYGRTRADVIADWHEAQRGIKERDIKRKLSKGEAAKLRNDIFPPRNIGCPYADTYCPSYW